MKKIFIFLLLINIASRAQIIYDCNLWGMASQGGAHSNGTVFSYNITSNTLTKKVDFSYSATGATPYGSLFLASDGNLYGMAEYGGTGFSSTAGGNCNGCGTLVEFETSTDSFIKRFDFDYAFGGPGSLPSGALIQATDGSLYGMTGSGANNQLSGAIFQYDLNTHTTVHKIDLIGGGSAAGSLIQASDGKLYGMIPGGANPAFGIIFSYEIISNVLTDLFDFDGAVNGYQPDGDLIQASNGLLYGMASSGGAHSNGVLFSYDIATNIFSKKIDFQSTATGSFPTGSLMQADNGKLYGLTSRGGINNLGTLFEYDIATNSLSKKVDFYYSIGEYPYGTLMQSQNGKLYGVTSAGGSGSGILFEYDIISNTLTKKAAFNASTGAKPHLIKLLEICKPIGIEPLVITIPNIFSPNADGINDTWNISVNFKNLIKNFEISIYNRWGNKIFSASDLNTSWNGNSPGGEACSEGTYYYQFSYDDLQSQRHKSKGFITLTR